MNGFLLGQRPYLGKNKSYRNIDDLREEGFPLQEVRAEEKAGIHLERSRKDKPRSENSGEKLSMAYNSTGSIRRALYLVT